MSRVLAAIDSRPFALSAPPALPTPRVLDLSSLPSEETFPLCLVPASGSVPSSALFTSNVSVPSGTTFPSGALVPSGAAGQLSVFSLYACPPTGRHADHQTSSAISAVGSSRALFPRVSHLASGLIALLDATAHAPTRTSVVVQTPVALARIHIGDKGDMSFVKKSRWRIGTELSVVA